MKLKGQEMPRARNTDPKTSHEAAASVKNLTRTQEYIMLLFKAKCELMTDEQLVAWYRWAEANMLAPTASESGIRSRRAELVREGYLFDSGSREKLKSGRNAIVWGVAKW
jgi:hypothetical protein